MNRQISFEPYRLKLHGDSYKIEHLDINDNDICKIKKTNKKNNENKIISNDSKKTKFVNITKVKKK